jgi:hypothetical protein
VIKEQLRSQVKSCERRRDVVPWSDASDSLMEKKPYHEWDELYASPDVRELFRYKKKGGKAASRTADRCEESDRAVP